MAGNIVPTYKFISTGLLTSFMPEIFDMPLTKPLGSSSLPTITECDSLYVSDDCV